jgi:hypothetical protein
MHNENASLDTGIPLSIETVLADLERNFFWRGYKPHQLSSFLCSLLRLIETMLEQCGDPVLLPPAMASIPQQPTECVNPY